MKNSAVYHVFPATFHVISRKIDFLWDSVHAEEKDSTVGHTWFQISHEITVE